MTKLLVIDATKATIVASLAYAASSVAAGLHGDVAIPVAGLVGARVANVLHRARWPTIQAPTPFGLGIPADVALSFLVGLFYSAGGFAVAGIFGILAGAHVVDRAMHDALFGPATTVASLGAGVLGARFARRLTHRPSF